MENVFLKVVNLSITAIWLILAVIVLRLVFRKAPKWIFCVLWGLVALRLIIPVSFESRFSLIPSAETLPADILDSDTLRIHSGIAFINNLNPEPDENGKIQDEKSAMISDLSLSDGTVYESDAYEVVAEKNAASGSGRSLRQRIRIFSYIWVVGFAAMLGYALISYILLKIRLSTAVREDTEGKRRIFRSENVPDPFVLGIISPCIFLPFALSDEDKAYVLAHEESHLKRGDHIWKFIGFVLLSIYWFNPFLWIAYIMLCNDIECACDEKVIATLGETERQSYSVALLNSSMGVTRKHIIACPVAFGDVSVKTRIKNVMNYKKPAFWIIIAAAAVCILLTACFLTNPVKKVNSVENDQTFDPDQYSKKELSELNISQNVYELILEDWDYFDSLDDFRRISSSKMPGWCQRYFDSWDEMTEFAGIKQHNPLENDHWQDMIFDKSGSGEKTYEIQFYGNRDGKLYDLSLWAYYPFEGASIQMIINAYNENICEAWNKEEEGERFSFTFASVDKDSSIDGFTCDVLLVHDEKYDSVMIALPHEQDFHSYYNVTSRVGTTRLKHLTDDLLNTLGLPLKYDTIIKAKNDNESIPGTDTDNDKDYFIDVNPDTEDTTDKIDINRK